MNLPLDEDLLCLAIGNMDSHTIYEEGGVAVGSGQNSIHPSKTADLKEPFQANSLIL